LLQKKANFQNRGHAVDTPAPDFTDLERDLASELLYQRYLKPVCPELADSELQLDAASEDLTVCPTLYLSARGANFVVCKVAEQRYRFQFFYADADHVHPFDSGQHTCGRQKRIETQHRLTDEWSTNTPRSSIIHSRCR
jgi:hypothetical protein